MKTEDIQSQFKNIIKHAITHVNPVDQAQHDYNKEGCNCNPYSKQYEPELYKKYESAFEDCELDEEPAGVAYRARVLEQKIKAVKMEAIYFAVKNDGISSDEFIKLISEL